jgi:hypothetical protein
MLRVGRLTLCLQGQGEVSPQGLSLGGHGHEVTRSLSAVL